MWKNNVLTRRDFLTLLGAAGIAVSTHGCAGGLPLKNNWPKLEEQKEPFMGLATSFPYEMDYEAEIEGTIPKQLRGTLFRNTTGLFDRDGLRKRTMFDGDGMMQAFYFHDKGVRFRNRFIQTEKFIDESAADRFIYPTFSTQAPGGFLTNFWPGNMVKSQAQISVFVRQEKIYAFDESSQPYELDIETLQTNGVSYLGLEPGTSIYSAHPKIDFATDEWIHFGLHYGKSVTLHITIFDKKGLLTNHRTIVLPRYAYIHDFFCTEKYLVFHLHPLEFKFFGFLLGLKSMMDCFQWKPEQGSLIMILNRNNNEQPIFMHTEASFMWHAINSFERNGLIVCDFIGYQHPDHFLGSDAPVIKAMQGRRGSYKWHGEFRRFVINHGQRTIHQETLLNDNHEWPMVNPYHRCHPYRFCYAARAQGDDFFWTGITKFDTSTGGKESFTFEKGLLCGEPVFAQIPGYAYDFDSENEPGWLMTEVYNSNIHKTFLAVFRADSISDGPIAKIYLQHHMPFSMHGFWHAKKA